MTDASSLSRPLDNDAEAAVLRQTLAQMRREAETEVQRLNAQIAERSRQTATSVASVAAQIALQQEMTVLNQTLKVKTQALDHITDECRRLEDALEDQNVTLDSLQQEIERKERALTSAREEVERMRRELANRAPSVANQFLSAAITALSGRRVRLWFGISAVLAALGSAGWWWREPLLTAWQRSSAAVLAQVTPAPVVTPPRTTSAPAAEPAAAPAPSPVITQSPPPTQRDRLRSGGLAPTLAALPGGTLQMGINRMGGEDYSPAHAVQLAPFLIGIQEVTVQEYDRFAQVTGRALPDDFGWGRGNQPVVGVSWADAVAYTEWLSRETGRQYRLPSEAEWEFAARAGSASSFWWGFTLEPQRAVCFDCGTAWDRRSPAPVGRFAANPFGLHDTAGNAMEWVADCYHPNYQGAPTDGRAWRDDTCGERVARGGAFNKPSASMRVYVRAHFSAETKLNSLGFRVARAR
ncbi:Sulphatase-modifying factor protein [Chromatium okenii]|uniref:formylglycine-generating enzyme family protein n=1 Tax=Chromatium okenii TaxID=61644 RepID=UPI001908A025|nr:formylglycine-generating enzyme family protein [Chromatium okenii]MBK1640431.1 Sulphatase-modifying factor protein [Chromatium okenii]